MIPFLITLAAVAYAAADLLAARFIYGRLRAPKIDHYSAAEWYYGDPVKRFDEYDRPFMAALAMALALIWPATFAGWLLLFTALRLARFLDGTSVKSRHELETERDAREQRIRELERQLGIKS
jgi:hypothetical protein